MKKLLITFFIFFMVSVMHAQVVDSLLATGDRLVKQFDNKKALEYYKQAENAEPENWKVLWRISRAYIDIAEHMPDQTDEQKKEQEELYKKALDYADRSVKQAPNEAVTYLRRAVANGRIALYKGVFSVSDVVNQVRDDAQKAIELSEPKGEYRGIAHYILARTHAKISEKWKPARSVLGLGWADIDEALKHYRQSIEAYPQLLMTHMDYARALVREDEYEKAREELNKVINGKATDEDDEKLKKEAKKLLEDIKDE